MAGTGAEPLVRDHRAKPPEAEGTFVFQKCKSMRHKFVHICYPVNCSNMGLLLRSLHCGRKWGGAQKPESLGV